MDYRFTVGADDSFPLPPSASSSPSGLVAGATVPPKVFTSASYSSDSSGDSGISLQFQPNGPFVGHSQVTGDVGSQYSDRTAEWLGTKCADTVSRRSPRAMNIDTNCRHSTASSGSGSGSSGSSGYLGSSGHVTSSPAASLGANNRLSNVTESRLSYISEPSSSGDSHTSLDRLDSEQTGIGCGVDVLELLRRGFSDSDVLHTWLAGMRLNQLHQLFVNAGYDMPTISRMTPEDLTAIGITQPAIRKRLTSEISRLNIDIGIPNVRMLSVQEWLHYLNLEEYYSSLTADGYTTIEAVMTLAWEDMEEIGIHKLGHQKKLMLAIDRLKKPPPTLKMTSSEFQFTPNPMVCSPTVTSLAQQSSSSNHPSLRNSPTVSRVRRSISGEGLAANGSHGHANPVNKGATEIIHLKNSPVVVRPEVVAIQINRTSNKFATDGSNQSPSAIKYESFRGPSVPAGSIERRGLDGEDRSSSTSTSTGDSSNIFYNDSAAPRIVTADKQLTVTAAATSATAAAAGHSSVISAAATLVRSPPPTGRPRPQIAPKPKVEIRQRRASAGASSDPRSEIAAAAAKVILAKTNSHCGESQQSSTSTATSREVLAGEPPSGRRLPSLPPSGGRGTDNKTCNGTLNGQISACSMTSLSQTVNSETSSQSQRQSCRIAQVPDGQTDNYHDSVGAESLQHRSVASDNKRTSTGETTTCSRPVTELSRPPSYESPSRKAPPAPPKRTNSFKGSSRTLANETDDNIGSARTNGANNVSQACNPSVLASSEVVTNSAGQSVDCDYRNRKGWSAHVRPISANQVVTGQKEPSCSPGPFDTNSLPFANENIGTIRQRGTAAGGVADAGEEVSVADTTLNGDERLPAIQKKTADRPVPMKKPKIAVKDGQVSRNDAEQCADDTISLDADDVFNDIDNMFEGLTQELDQMLMS